MFALERRKYFDWILSVIVGASFVVLMFYASISSGLTSSKIWSASMFVAAIPLGISALLLSKEAELYKNNELKSLDGGHAILFLLSIIFFFVGFIILVHSVSSTLSVTFSVAGIISIVIYIRVRKEIVNRENS